MRATMTAAAMCCALTLAACGGDDDDGAGNDVQADVAEAVMTEASGEGIELDRDCVVNVANQLSDEDARAILETIGTEEDPDVSEEGDALGEELFGCASKESLIDEIVASIGGLDAEQEACVRDVLDGLSTDDFAQVSRGEGAEADEVQTRLTQDLLPCTGG